MSFYSVIVITLSALKNSSASDWNASFRAKHTAHFNGAMPVAFVDRGNSGSRRRLHDDPTSTSRLAPLSSSTSQSSLSRKPSSSTPLALLPSPLPNAKSPLGRQGRQDWLAEQLATRAQQRDKKAREDQDAQKLERDRRWSPLLRRAEFTQEFNLAWQERQRPLLDPGSQGELQFPWVRVMALNDLLALRLAGLSLGTLPESLPDALPQLTTLSLVACELEVLPERLGELRMLTELDVTGNQLCSLPASLSKLARLERLTLVNNKLETLPDDIGGGEDGSDGLQRLERLLVEQNALRSLPASVGTLSSVVLINLIGNKLEKLPESIGNLPRLETLSVSVNFLVELPETLAKLPKLRVLRANRNALRNLPHNFGDFDVLEDVQLDWNALRELPFSLRKLRTRLRVLSLEENPLVLPPSEVVVRGVAATMAYMDKALDEFHRRARRAVLEALQQVLQLVAPLALSPDTQKPQQSAEEHEHQLSDDDKEDLATIRSLFEPHCKHAAPANGGEQLPFFAVVWGEFYDSLLPAIERKLQRLTVLAAADINADDVKSTVKADAFELSKAARFSSRFTPEEVEDALANSADDFGAASVQVTSALFRKCACLEPLALQTARTGDDPKLRPSTPLDQTQQRQARRRRVCAPPGVAPYRCRRAARLIREQLLTRDEAKDQLATTYLRTKLARLEAATKRQCVEYINSETGVVHFEQLAAQLAAALLGKRKRLRALEAKHKKAVEKIAARRAKLLAKLEAYARARASRREALESKIAKLSAKAASGNAASEKRVKRLEQELAEELALGGGGASGDGDDDPRVLELELALEGLTGAEAKLTDAHAAAKTRELSSFLDETKGVQGGGEDEDSDGNEDEDDSDDNDNDSDDDEEDEGDDEEEEEEGKSSLTPSKAEPDGAEADPTAENSLFQFDLPDVSLLIDYRVAAMQQVERELEQRQQELDQQHEAKYSAKKGKPKPPPTLVVHLEELVELFQPRVRDAYVAERCARVAHRATVEYLQMRAVLRRWLGHGKRAVFEAWRDYMRANRADAEKWRAKRERRKLLEEQNRALAEQLVRREARKWVQRVDVYTDAVYFEHSESSETSWTPPQYWEEEQQLLQQHEASHQPEQPPVKETVRLPRI